MLCRACRRLTSQLLLCLLAFLLQALTLAGLGIAGVVQASVSMLQGSSWRMLNLQEHDMQERGS